ncbi:MAG TPA: GNAT family N-acetyltransferase [Gemmatimonadales bacterium]|nr:GNAT family N-acetyltransferase [Gemmatimonadales bacterium]
MTPAATAEAAAGVQVMLRLPIAYDRRDVEEMLRAARVFRDDEIAVGLEVFDASLAGDDSYRSLVAERAGSVVGWICWGPTPCTVGTWDMYWLAVSPAMHGSGIGTRLVAEMERRLTGVARMVVVETAGRPDYAPTRAFYEARGYRRAASIPDFYAPGDDQVVYVKFFVPSTDSYEGR